MTALNPLRTDKVSGTLTGGFGVTMMGFSAFGLLIVVLQCAAIATMGPIPIRPDGFDFGAAMNAMHRLWFLYMPLMFAGGLVFAICGWRIYRDSVIARHVAQCNAVLGYLWGIAYTLAAVALMDQFGKHEIPFELSPQLMAGYRWFVIIASIAFNSLFPTGLLLILPQPKQQTLDAILLG